MKTSCKRVTLQGIAERAGVSRNTVSCALRNHPSLPEATCERIQALARSMGYRPDPHLSEVMTYLNARRRTAGGAPLILHPMHPTAEIHRRAERLVGETALKVDYYRIRRRFAWPLPVALLSDPPSEPVPGIPQYPWATWLAWALEERIFTLGWAAERGAPDAVRNTVRLELEALASFPAFFSKPGSMTLCAAHFGRTLGTALGFWQWTSGRLRETLRGALARYLAEAAPAVEWAFAEGEAIARGEASRLLHNIPAIGALACAQAAALLGHPLRDPLDTLCMGLLRVIGERQRAGSEGICYDGYVLDFALSWLKALPGPVAAERASALDLNALYARTLAFGLPENPASLAPIGDVEPVEMPFHLCAQAKLERLSPAPGRAAWLHAIPLSWMRADALAHLPEPGEREFQPPSGIVDGGYALSLRNGGTEKGFFAVVSAHASPFSHLHKDNGHVCIASRGEWLIIDPGYQQYLPTAEREFTIGASAHNTPVINGHAQTCVPARRSFFSIAEGAGWRAVSLDLAAAYDPSAGILTVRRCIWQTREGTIAVADEVCAGGAAAQVDYFWHAAPHVYWGREEAGISLHGDASTLQIHAPGFDLVKNAAVSRLKGSRGSLTLHARREAAQPLWWVFSPFASAPVLEDGGRALRLKEGVRLSLSDFKPVHP